MLFLLNNLCPRHAFNSQKLHVAPPHLSSYAQFMVLDRVRVAFSAQLGVRFAAAGGVTLGTFRKAASEALGVPSTEADLVFVKVVCCLSKSGVCQGGGEPRVSQDLVTSRSGVYQGVLVQQRGVMISCC